MLKGQFPKSYLNELLKEPIEYHTYEEYCAPRLCMGEHVISKEVFNALHNTEALCLLARVKK